MPIKAINQDRASLDFWKNRYPKAIIAPSFLRLEKTLEVTATTIAFDVTQVNTPRVTERRLQISDAFVCTSIGMFILKAAGTNSASTDAQITKSQEFVNEAPNVFSSNSQGTNLKALYNGFLRLTIDQRVEIDSFPCTNFRRVFTTQQGTTIFTSSTSALDEAPDAGVGYYGLTPNIFLNGAGKFDLSLNLPTSTDLSSGGSASYSTALRLTFRGFLIQGAGALEGNRTR